MVLLALPFRYRYKINVSTRLRLGWGSNALWVLMAHAATRSSSTGAACDMRPGPQMRSDSRKFTRWGV